MKRTLLMAIGFIATGLGFIGVFLPLLPTVPFILLAMFCFSKSSTRFERWLLNNKLFGPTVHRIQTKQGLTRKEKARILILSWTSICLTIVFVLDRTSVQLLLAGILLIETWVMIRMPTCSAKSHSAKPHSAKPHSTKAAA
ncbi:YbaN family protein [Vibrio sp. 10N.261.55.A7]|uniref:YbaN family protein n=1 Tax=Vibrio sp. 10N.261.55.A7 TaxID=1880851 RepID=UPI000C82B404|nr:YbaN family protein [Vibrio sp. 10N.261.55.A7]PMJ96410.1 hypothetical protein BCU12_04875 [Vibrio sp. 10N.261.55.A7]